MSARDSNPPVSRDWRHHPDLPIGFTAFWDWPPDPMRLGAYLLRAWLGVTDRLVFVVLAFASFYLLQPPLDALAPLSLGTILLVAMRNAVILMIVAGGLHWWLYMRQGQGERFKFDPRPMLRNNNLFSFRDQVRDNAFWSMTSGVAQWTAYELLFLQLYGSGALTVFHWSDGAVWFVALFLLIPIFQSMHFYFTHRFILHAPGVYGRVHRLHHRNVNIGPWSGLSMHPLEHLIYLSSVLIHLVIPSHPVHMLFHLYWLTLGAVTAHAGYEALMVGDKRRFELGAFFHQLHHRYYECNYGTNEMPWDKWLGTFHDGGEEATRQTRARKKRLHAHLR